MRTLLLGRRRLVACPWCASQCCRWSPWRSTLTQGWTNSADGGPGRSSTLGGGSCMTPLMAWSGGTSRGRAGSCCGVFARRCTTTGAGLFSAEHESLFMRQSTMALGRISAFCTRSSLLEIWYIIFSWFRFWQLLVLFLGVA